LFIVLNTLEFVKASAHTRSLSDNQ